MNLLAAIILGLLMGWLIEWIIDWFYWRGRLQRAANENADLRERITSVEAGSRKKAAPSRSPILTDQFGNDNFQVIKGIGPAFSKRLNDAGIHTFERLAELTPEEMEEILGTLYKRVFSKQNTIIAQAKQFAQLKAQNG